MRAGWGQPSLVSRGACAFGLRLKLAAALVVGATMLAASMASAVAVPPAGAQAGPLANPAGNLGPPALSTRTGACQPAAVSTASGSPMSWDCASPCFPHWVLGYNDSPGCLSLLLAALNAAQRSEHVRTLALPSDFRSLSVPEQLFVLVNLERLSRGVPPLVGLSPYLDAAAAAAAQAGQDPPFRAAYGPVRVWWPQDGGLYGYGATWAGNVVDATAAVFGWMYSDGWGGSAQRTTNLACTGPGAPGCWGHRDLLLGEGTGTACTDCIAGAGFSLSAKGGWAESYTFLLVRPVVPVSQLSFSWARDVVPHLPAAWERAAL